MVIIESRQGFNRTDGAYCSYIVGNFESDGTNLYCQTPMGLIIIPVSEVILAMVLADGFDVSTLSSDAYWIV